MPGDARQYEQKSCTLQLRDLSPGSAMKTGLFCSAKLGKEACCPCAESYRAACKIEASLSHPACSRSAGSRLSLSHALT